MPEWNEEFLEQYIRPGHTAVNVGAHEGHWCRKLTSQFQRIIAIEASQKSAMALSAQRIPHVEIIQAAAWIVGGHKMPFNVREGVSMSSSLACRDIMRDAGVSSVTDVKTIAVDELKLERCDLLMVDVEGAEVQVLQGATRTVEQFHPDLIIECHEREHRDWLTTWLERAGYNLAHVHEPQRELHDEWGRHVYLIGSYYRPRG